MSLIKFMVLPASVLFIASIPHAQATLVEYSTAGTFMPSDASSETFLTDGGVGFQNFVEFTGVNTATVDLGGSPLMADLGTFFSGVVTGTSTTASGTFTLTIDQNLSGHASESFSPATLSGTLSRIGGGGSGPLGSSGEFILTFTNPTLVIDGIQYSIDGLGQGGLGSDQLGLPLYNTQINANITSVAPEPSFMWFTAAALACLFVIARRRRLRWYRPPVY